MDFLFRLLWTEIYLYLPYREYKNINASQKFGRKTNRRRRHMANLGISHTHVNQYGSVPAKKPVTARHRIQTAIHVTFFTAAFLFVVAMVCGVVG